MITRHARSVPRLRISAALAAAMLALTGCATGPVPDSAALPPVPERYAAPTPAAQGLAPTAWWRVFGDAELDALVARAEAGNPTLAAATARVAQARALLRGSESARSPQLGATMGANRQGGPLVNAAGGSGTLISAALGASWELDLFGRLAQADAAAALDLLSRQQALRAVRLLVQAEVTQTWLALRALDAERAAARRDAAAWAQTLQLSEQRWRAGSISEVALLRLRAEQSGSAADAALLERRRAELQHALALLLGTPASDFALPEEAAATAPEVPAIPAGLPAEMLARRPDIAAAQAAWQAAQQRRGQARAAWFPSFTLTASGGHATPALAELLQAGTRAWGLGLLGALPLLDGGRREAAVQQADAQTEIDFAAYRGQVLQAFQEVEDQLVALATLQAQRALLTQASAAAARALAAIESRQRQGLASMLELLDARRQAVRSERRLLQLQGAQAQATVALVRALGGGWGAGGGAADRLPPSGD